MTLPCLLYTSFYQLTNHVTLGITEKEAIDNISTVALQIAMQERNLRATTVSYTHLDVYTRQALTYEQVVEAFRERFKNTEKK